VLGEFYLRCDRVVTVPVHLNTPDGELLGYADESLGIYADAFTFHLSEELCKKLSAGHFTYSFDYDFASSAEKKLPVSKRRIKLSSIVLVARKGYDKPVPKGSQEVAAGTAETAA
jgi:hypothetical protein